MEASVNSALQASAFSTADSYGHTYIAGHFRQHKPKALSVYTTTTNEDFYRITSILRLAFSHIFPR
jgi:hypothetical protein